MNEAAIFPDLLGNEKGITRTLRIDSKVLAAGGEWRSDKEP